MQQWDNLGEWREDGQDAVAVIVQHEDETLVVSMPDNTPIGVAAEKAAGALVSQMGHILPEVSATVFWLSNENARFGPFTVSIDLVATAKGLRGGE